VQTVASGRHKCNESGECDASKVCLKTGAAEAVGAGLPTIIVDRQNWPVLCTAVRSAHMGASELLCLELYSVCPLSVVDDDAGLLFAICQGIDYGNRITTYDDLMAQPWWVVDASNIFKSELNRIEKERESNSGNESRKS